MRWEKSSLALCVMIVVTFTIITTINQARADLLPGWSMRFNDYEPDMALFIKVIQKDPGSVQEGEIWSSMEQAGGFGTFEIGDLKGTLYVKSARWSNYAWPGGNLTEAADFPDQGFPESAKVSGRVRLGFFQWANFYLLLKSHCYPGFPLDGDRDLAKLVIDGDSYEFTGQLHHSRLRALFKPSDGMVAEQTDESVSNALFQAYPNPANPSTSISYLIGEPGQVTLMIYNSLGQAVITLVNEYQETGAYTVHWDGRDSFGNTVTNGMYFYQIRKETYIETKKILFIK